MPNRYVQALFYQLYKKNEYDKAHPQEAQANAIGEGLSELA